MFHSFLSPLCSGSLYQRACVHFLFWICRRLLQRKRHFVYGILCMGEIVNHALLVISRGFVACFCLLLQPRLSSLCIFLLAKASKKKHVSSLLLDIIPMMISCITAQGFFASFRPSACSSQVTHQAVSTNFSLLAGVPGQVQRQCSRSQPQGMQHLPHEQVRSLI